MLLYRKLRTDLEEMGFDINSYDPCVANQGVDGSQWDDLEVLHKDKAVVTHFAKELGC